MTPRAKVLVVEDEAVIYYRLRKALLKNNFGVSEYVPSYEKAIKVISSFKPDIVLLDIKLIGSKTGLDLGNSLSSQFNIPFIYLTDYADDETFFEGLNTKHEAFIVKTKPTLDIQEVIRGIYTVLQRGVRSSTSNHVGLIGLVDYLENIRVLGSEKVSKKPIPFNDILLFSNREDIGRQGDFKDLRKNYLWFLTSDENVYLVKNSLQELSLTLPFYFVRVNESYIVNLQSEKFEGRINGKKLKIGGNIVDVSKTYMENFNSTLNKLYLS